MKLKVDKQIFERWPEVKLGVVIALEIDNTQAGEKSINLVRQEEENKRQDLEVESLEEKPFVANWRQAYQEFGANPKKYSSSIESLLRSVLSGRDLPDINPLVNFYNYLSLKYLLPFGGEDLDKIKGDVHLAISDGTEKGIYLGGKDVRSAKKGEVVYKDEIGFICRRWNWREAERTAFQPETQNAILVTELLPPVSTKKLKNAVEELAELVEEDLSGEVVTAILDKDNPQLEVDFKTGSRLTEEDIDALKEKKEKPEKKAVDKREEKEPIKIQKPDWLASEKIKKLIANVCQDLGIEIEPSEVHLEHPANPKHGDYASNLAMAKFKELKSRKAGKHKCKSPIKLAELISEKINGTIEQSSNGAIDRIAVAPPGFINFWLKKDFLVRAAEEIGDEEEFKEKMGRISHGKTMVIDYSSPNIAKAFGIGHLRSTNIGQAIYNLYTILGWKTIGDNHLGDWGTQFGKLIVAIKMWWKKDIIDLTIAKMEKLYVKFHKEAKENPELEKKGRQWFKKLEQGDKEAKNIWQICVDISLKEFDRVYDLLGVEIDEAYGEAFYHYQGWMDQILTEAKKEGLLKKSQGAKVVDVPGLETPGMLVKSDGATTYLTRDLATIKFRQEKWDPDLVVYEVGSEQKFHFKQLFALSEMFGYIPAEKLVHVAHGLLRLPSGKFSTREGKTIRLKKVLTEAVSRAEEIVDSSETSAELGKEEKEKIAQAVGIGGVKFNDLKQEPEKDIIFDWDKVLSLEGYSAPYLQYTYARCSSVISKSEIRNLRRSPILRLFGVIGPKQFLNDQMLNDQMINREEEALLRKFYIFPEIIISAAENFGPHFVCQYLFDLAQKFNLFYQKHRILDPEQSNNRTIEQSKILRLFLTKTTASILKTGLELLGIKVLERM